MFIMPEYKKLRDYPDYLTENYVDSEVKFSISIWIKMTSSVEKLKTPVKVLIFKH